MRLAIMQPYFLLYVGYFQLIAAVDGFILYKTRSNPIRTFSSSHHVNRTVVILNPTGRHRILRERLRPTADIGSTDP